MSPYVAILGAVAVASAAAGWQVNDAIWEGKEARSNVEIARQFAEATQVRDALSARLREAEDVNQLALKKAENETRRLAADLVGLRIRAACMPKATTSPGVATGPGAELDPTARSAYFGLRSAIDRAEAKLSACQAELKLRS